jgi:Ankyrin repeats (3 copies)/PQQ-like domain
MNSKDFLTFIILLFSFTAFAQDEAEVFLEAAQKNDIETVKKFLDEGTDVNTTSKYGATALTFAADIQSVELTRLLLEHKADPNIVDLFYGATPFLWSISEDNYEIVKLMVENGADLSTPKPMYWASGAEDVQIVKLLIDNGCPGAEEIFIGVVKNKKLDLLDILLDSGQIGEKALTDALVFAYAIENDEVVNRLKTAGAKLPEKKESEEVNLADFQGVFEPNEGNSVTIEVVDNILNAIFGNPYKLIHLEKGNFQFMDYPTITLKFRYIEEQIVGFDLYQEDTTQYNKVSGLVKEEGTETKEIIDEAKSVENPMNWTSFRGNNADGIGDGQHPPLVWNIDKGINLKWKTFIPGLAHACPIIWEDKVFIITAIGSDSTAEYRVGLYGDIEPANDNSEHVWEIYCLDKISGDVIWNKEAYKGIPRVERHTKATQANSTPVTNGEYVVALFGSEGMVCYDMDGNEKWKIDLGILDAGWFFNENTQWGHSSSPIIYNDYVIVQCDRSKDSYIAAYKLEDGTEVWRTERDAISSWGTPSIYLSDTQNEVITNGTKFINSYNPDTGEELWKLTPNSEVTVATPVVYEDLIYVTAGYPPVRPVYAIKPGGKGDISIADSLDSGEYIQWRTKRGGTYMPSPIAYDGYFYTLANNGVLTCYDAKTGEQKYRQRIKGGNAFTASIVAADGKLYCTSEEKGVFVVKAGPEYEVITNNLIGEICMATPAISNGMIFIRGQHHLFCIGYKK